MTYYIFLENGKLNGAGQCQQLTEGIENIEVSEEVYNLYNEEPEKFIYSDGKIVENSEYDTILAQAREKKFNEEFFNTSLGFIRRKVTMQDGTTKDFLTDLLPLMKIGVPILAYDKPDFTNEITEAEFVKLQKQVIITETFLEECQARVIIDFYGFNPMDK